MGPSSFLLWNMVDEAKLFILRASLFEIGMACVFFETAYMLEYHWVQ